MVMAQRGEGGGVGCWVHYSPDPPLKKSCSSNLQWIQFGLTCKNSEFWESTMCQLNEAEIRKKY